MESLVQRLQYAMVCVLLIVSLILLPLLISTATRGNGLSLSSGFVPDGTSSDPNAVSRTMNSVLGGFENIAAGVGSTTSGTGRSVAAAASDTVAIVAGGGKAVVGAIGSGTVAVGRGIGTGAVAIIRFPGAVLGSVTKVALADSVIKPAADDEVQTIDPAAKILAATAVTYKAKPKASASSTAWDGKARWPIHGRITTEFGASDWPYQAVHTGIDISDGHGSGVTPVHPFLPGKVVKVVHSSVSLGNHVVVDHGNGLTSVYGHMSSISVHKGQQVSQSTRLGYEGSTGASTGPHVHFEVKVNGKFVNPHRYIRGNP